MALSQSESWIQQGYVSTLRMSIQSKDIELHISWPFIFGVYCHYTANKVGNLGFCLCSKICAHQTAYNIMFHLLVQVFK